MINFADVKYLRIPNGVVKAISIGGTLVWKSGYLNLVPLSIDTDGSIYNGKGYKENYRLNSSGVPSALNGAIHSGFIPYTAGGVIRAKGCTVPVSQSGQYVACYDANFNCLKSATSSSIAAYAKYGSYVQQSDGKYLLTVSDLALYLSESYSIDINNVKYVRISMPSCAAADFIVTIDEEIN